MKLSDIQCKSAKSKEKPYKIGDGGGMYLEVMPNGSKYWRLKYRVKADGKWKEKRLAIGVYPEITLKQARERRDEARRLLDEGRDPSFEKKKRKAMVEKDRENTFKALALEWYDNRKDRWRPRYAAEVITRLEKDIFPQLGDYPVTEISPRLLLSVIRPIENRGAHELAKRQLQNCGEIFCYGIAVGKAERDPSRDIRDALKPIELVKRGKKKNLSAEAFFANLSVDIPQRELKVVGDVMGWPEENLHIRQIKKSASSGNVVFLKLEHENVTETVVSFGRLGVKSEKVAQQACDEANDYLNSKAAVGVHLADQLLLPTALAGEGKFTTLAPSQHTKTNIEVIKKFVPCDITVEDTGNDVWQISISEN
ncbi:MAG: integrase arm-type DNA-binding domain-containing protein [Alphaproteobacteria bacterium]|nr:integrase arm-type DNA-binding domain-containing protein [Alphaproteobacteria bacterium]